MWELLTSEIPFNGMQGVQVAWVVVVKEKVDFLSNSASLFAIVFALNPTSRPVYIFPYKNYLFCCSDLPFQALVRHSSQRY